MNNDNVIMFWMDEEILDISDRCGFCHDKLQRGKYIQAGESPAICFSCVKRCVELLADDTPELDWEE